MAAPVGFAPARQGPTVQLASASPDPVALPTPQTTTGTESPVFAPLAPGTTSSGAVAGWRPGQVFEVRSRTELLAALSIARNAANVEIRVHPGSYGELRLLNRPRTTGRLHIVAATSTRPAFTFVSFNGSHNLLLAGMFIKGPGRLLEAGTASDILLVGNLFSGANYNNDPWDDGNVGFHIRNSARITLSDNIFTDLRNGGFFQRTPKITIQYNTLRYVREGMNFAATDNLDIYRNHAHNFYPMYANREHPDVFQFWTANETVGATNVRIRQNVLALGGCRAIQGIFAGSTVSGVKHRNFLLEGNVYYGSSSHGLSIFDTIGLVFRNNVVLPSPYADMHYSGYSDPTGECSGALNPGINTTNSTGKSFVGNITTAQIPNSTTSSNNFDLQEIRGTRIGGGLPWTELFAARVTADAPPLRAFLTRNPSAARTAGAGIRQEFPYGAGALPLAELISRALAAHKP